MVYGEPRRGLDVADRARGWTDGEGQLKLGLRGCIIGFPTTLGFTVCEFAMQMVKNTFDVLAVSRGGRVESEFVLMFGAGRRDDVGVFLDAPAQFLDAPPLLHVFAKILDNSRNTNLNEELADGVDGGRKDDPGEDVGRGKEASRRSVATGWKGALHRECTGEGDCPFEIGMGLGAELVFDTSKGTVGCCRKMARKKVGKWETIFPSHVANGFGDENPFFEFIPLDRAIGAVFDRRFLEGDRPEKYHFELFQHDFGFQNRNLELAGKNRTRRADC